MKTNHRSARFRQLLKERIVFLDGAMGTMIQRHRLQEAAPGVTAPAKGNGAGEIGFWCVRRQEPFDPRQQGFGTREEAVE